MTKQQIIEELELIRKKLQPDYKSSIQMTSLYNAIVVRTCSWFPSYSKTRLYEYLQKAEKMLLVWENRNNMIIEWLVDLVGERGYLYDEDLLDAWTQLIVDDNLVEANRVV